jgi:hypothetical protein
MQTSHCILRIADFGIQIFEICSGHWSFCNCFSVFSVAPWFDPNLEIRLYLATFGNGGAEKDRLKSKASNLWTYAGLSDGRIFPIIA